MGSEINRLPDFVQKRPGRKTFIHWSRDLRKEAFIRTEPIEIYREVHEFNIKSLICKLRHATRSQSEHSHFNAKTRNVLSLYQFTVAEQTLTIMKCKLQAYLGKCRIRRKSSKLETEPLGFVPAGAELPTLYPFSTEEFLIRKKLSHYHQEASSVVKEELISTHSGKVQFQLFHRWAIARY